VTASKFPDDLEIAPGSPGYTVGDWMRLNLKSDEPDAPDWERALTIFDARIRRRFLDPVDELIKIDKTRSPQTFSFAILAIDFLIIETLQGFREGKTEHKGKDVSKNLIVNFLTQWDVFDSCLPQDVVPIESAERIYKGYRCALHHSGSTDGAMFVGISGPVFALENMCKVKINRTSLHQNLKCE
jgi:hypothetical protein